MAMRSLGYMPNEVELEVIIQRLDIDGMFLSLSRSLWVSKFKSAQAVALNPTLMSYTLTRLYFCAFHQVTVKLALKNLSHCLDLNSLLLECLISSTEQTLIRCFGRYVVINIINHV